MKISTKELRQLIRETIEETIKEAPISGLGMGSTPRGGGFAGAKPPSRGQLTDMTSDDPAVKLVDKRLLGQMTTRLLQSIGEDPERDSNQTPDPVAAKNFLSLTQDVSDPRVVALVKRYKNWQSGIQEAKLRKMIGDIIKEQKATPKKRK